MKKIILIAIGILFLLPIGFVFAQSASPALSAKAEIKNAQGESIGTAALTEVPEGVKITIRVSKLIPGKHGIHIHEFGKCDPPDFKSSGGHFNPTHREHGLTNPKGAHGGDLPNLGVGPDGTANMELITKTITLAPGPNSLIRPEGTSIIIHAKEDDEKTDPSGNSGDRIACGIITS